MYTKERKNAKNSTFAGTMQPSTMNPIYHEPHLEHTDTKAIYHFILWGSRTYEKTRVMHCLRSSKSGTAAEPESLPCDSTYREQIIKPT